MRDGGLGIYEPGRVACQNLARSDTLEPMREASRSTRRNELAPDLNEVGGEGASARIWNRMATGMATAADLPVAKSADSIPQTLIPACLN